MGIKLLTPLVLAILHLYGVYSAEFTVKNNCGFDIWPAATGTVAPIPTGFHLAPQASRTIAIPAPWSGRFWARFECSSPGGRFTCISGDCGSGQVECNGAGGARPATLVEFTLAGANGQDFYDVSLVDGFNLPVSVSPAGGGCPTTSCAADLNRDCPEELAVRDAGGAIVGCTSACVAFGTPQYCCTEEFNSPVACMPNAYTAYFKTQCPQAYSYAYDDATSTFTCPTGGNYLITFCPN